LNREGPEGTCSDLVGVACHDGILATCVGGSVKYQVCDDKDVCVATWQVDGQYRCNETDPVPQAAHDMSVSGMGGAGDGSAGGAGGATVPDDAAIMVCAENGTSSCPDGYGYVHQVRALPESTGCAANDVTGTCAWVAICQRQFVQFGETCTGSVVLVVPDDCEEPDRGLLVCVP
jgi:hypothetical protein